MTNKKVILRLPKVLESLGTGVMEYWSVDKKGINPSAIAPTLQYSLRAVGSTSRRPILRN